MGSGGSDPEKDCLRRQHRNRDLNDKKEFPTGKSEGQKFSIKENGKYDPMFHTYVSSVSRPLCLALNK